MVNAKSHDSGCFTFPRNGQNIALLLPKHGPHMVIQIGSNLTLNHCAQRCSIPNFTLLGLSCSPLSWKWLNMALLWPKNGAHMVLHIGYS